ncbi:unnamed protein product [Caenorhabditis bovis]|uniref:T20D4.11-like domain-containing protein n=1 Tax=Caenorhabditis bovis TaxID=2654633 RepID=A0A8S1EEW1_9PELO|nr:unnamed protein product [Caenorhabditis bovis]
MLKSLVILFLLVGCSFAAVTSQCMKTETKKIQECTKLIENGIDGIQKMIISKFDPKKQKEVNEICKKAQNCFGDLKKNCPDFPKDATLMLDYLCGKVTFITGPFSECMKKLIMLDDTPTAGCGAKIINGDVFDDPKKSCKAVKDTIACEKDIGKVCDAKMEKLFHAENQGDLKRFKC